MKNKKHILVILHGWQSSKEKWQQVKQNLESRDLKVVIPDIPGFKTTNELKRAWRLDDYVKWLKNFQREQLLEKSTEPFFLLGHSFGGRIAIKFAADYPKELSGLILVSAAGIKHHPKTKKFLSCLSRVFKKFSFLPFYTGIRSIIYKYILRKTDYIQAHGFLKQTFLNIVAEDITPFLSHIKTPTLILWGKKDRVTPLADGYLMKAKISNSRLIILKNVGHAPYLEKPQLLAREIKFFIANAL